MKSYLRTFERLYKGLIAGTLLVYGAGSAMACFTPESIDFQDLFVADLLAIGSIQSFEIVTFDPEIFRAWSDYAIITISVEETFSFVRQSEGMPTQISFVWVDYTENSFSEQLLPNNQIVVALRRTKKFDIPPALDPQTLRLMEEVCSSGLIFALDSEMGQSIQQVMDGMGDARSEVQMIGKVVNTETYDFPIFVDLRFP
jgi:hypothetical protein